MNKPEIRNCYSTADGHGFAAAVDGRMYPWAHTPRGALIIFNRWQRSGLTEKQIETGTGCGWTVEYAQRFFELEIPNG